MRLTILTAFVFAAVFAVIATWQHTIVNEGPTTECSVKKIGIERVTKTALSHPVTINALTELRLQCGKDDVWFHSRREMKWAGLTTNELENFDMRRTVFCRRLYSISRIPIIKMDVGPGYSCGFVE